MCPACTSELVASLNILDHMDHIVNPVVRVRQREVVYYKHEYARKRSSRIQGRPSHLKYVPERVILQDYLQIRVVLH